MDDARCMAITKAELYRCGRIAMAYYNFKALPIKLEWNLFSHSTAGLAIGHKVIRINLHMMRHQTEDDIKFVAAHELAHVVVHKAWYINTFLPWMRNIDVTSIDAEHFDTSQIPPRPEDHGATWRFVMALFDHAPKVYHHYDTSHLRSRRKRFNVYCACGETSVTERKLQQILSERVIYHCKVCKCPLTKDRT